MENYQLAIIGAGPAGIATAVEAYMLGMRDIIIIEKDENHNATIRKFYKDKKRVDKDWKGQKVELDGNIYFMDGTKESTLDFFDDILDNHSVKLTTHTEVQKILQDDEGFDVMIAGGSISAKYVVVTIGRMGKPNKPDYKIPGPIKKRVGFTLEACSQDEKILVVGGGDSAIEYAVDLAVRNKVSLCYRRETFRRANPTNQANITRAINNKDVTPILGVNIDGVIGGTTPSAFLSGSGIEERDGKPVHDEQYQTGIDGLYVAGDITQESGGSIALGLNHGYAIAHHILDNDDTLRRDDSVLKVL